MGRGQVSSASKLELAPPPNQYQFGMFYSDLGCFCSRTLGYFVSYGLAAVPSLGFKSFFDVVKYDSIPRFMVPTVQYVPVSETYKQLMDEFCIQFLSNTRRMGSIARTPSSFFRRRSEILLPIDAYCTIVTQKCDIVT